MLSDLAREEPVSGLLMFTERDRAALEVLTVLQYKLLSLCHQFFPENFRLFHGDREILDTVENEVPYLEWKLFHPQLTSVGLFSLSHHLFLPPVESLSWNIGGAYDINIRIDKEERENFAMPRFSRIGQFERLDLMLKDIRKCDKPAFPSIDAAQILDAGFFVLKPKNVRQPLPEVLLVPELADLEIFCLLAECEARMRYVGGRVVVYCTRANFLVLAVARCQHKLDPEKS